MNDLLPQIDELKPITNSNTTFYDCGFNTDFNSLSEQKKLQIICDIVRETILPTPFPNPENELSNLEGNCSTACLVAEKYLKELNLCKDVKHVMARKRSFDPDDIVSIHSILLVRGNDDNIYQFDPTPFVGYKFGSVEKIDKPFYEEYTELNDDMELFLSIFKEISYLNHINKIDLKKVDYYVYMCLNALDYKALGAYSGNALKGFPGVYTHYADDTIGEDGLLKIMEGIEDRTAYFKESIAYCEPGKEPVVFEGLTKGKIDIKKSGTFGWSWDFIFIPDGEDKTLGCFPD